MGAFPWRRRGSIAVVVTLLVTVAVGVAYGAKLTTKSKTAVLPADSAVHSVTAKCPKGTKATGGGVQLGSPSEEVVEGFHPAGGRRWTAFARRSVAFPDESELTAFARCLQDANLRTTSITEVLPGDESPYTATTKCPKGTKLVGGGIRLGDDGDGVRGSYPASKREWTAIASRGQAGDSEFTALARCLKRGKVTRRSSTAPLLADGVPHAATAKCPKGTRVTGGGIEPGATGASVRGSYPVGKRKWTAISSVIAPGDIELTAHVLCLKKRK